MEPYNTENLDKDEEEELNLFENDDFMNNLELNEEKIPKADQLINKAKKHLSKIKDEFYKK